MTFQDLANRLKRLHYDERSEFTGAYIISLVASENLVRALDDFEDDINAFRDYKDDDFRDEINKSWEEFAYKAKRISKLLKDYLDGKNSEEMYQIK